MRPPRPNDPPDYHDWHIDRDIDIDIDDPHYSRYHDDYYWWAWPTTAVVGGWFVWEAFDDDDDQVYYSYGTGGNVYYEDNYYYVNNEQVPADQYYESVTVIADQGANVTPEQAEKIEWMPLGIFAYAEKGSASNGRYMQLAVSKEGIIGGTYFNENTNTSRPLEGAVDPKTQKAAWTFADGLNTDVILEAGIFDFTKDEVSVMVHYGATNNVIVSLIRVEPPEQPAAEGGAPADAASPAPAPAP